MFIVLSPPSPVDPGIAVAGTRAGALGVLNLEFATDTTQAVAGLRVLEEHAHGPYGVLLDAGDGDMLARVLEENLPGLSTVILNATAAEDRLMSGAAAIKATGRTAYLVVTSLAQAQAAEQAGFDGLIARGNESGGWIGEETAFVLAQHLAGRVSIPFWVQGGIGLHSAAAAMIAGAEGVVLDEQLLLARESALPDRERGWLEAMDGAETQVLGSRFGAPLRFYSRRGLRSPEELRLLEAGEEARENAAWRLEVKEKLQAPDGDLLVVGQAAAFAAGLARRFVTVGGIVGAIRDSIEAHLEAAREQDALAAGSAWAHGHSTRYPIVQGPMTRVSDRAAFAEAVATAGGLPFLALALMRGPDIEGLLRETSERLAGRSWGAGILGFVPPDLREEQLAVVRSVKPPFALIAGGRPDQAKALEAEGIATYLHVPSPGLLKLFLSEGGRRFVFEGRECGGHVGPRTSFVLWESMIEVLLGFIESERGAEIDVLFAGGVHDGLSGAMVAAMAAPLVERGVRIGVLAGTSYLFTREAVTTGAIQQGFQDAALACEGTVMLESTPGYATRCLPSPFADVFEGEKRRLVRDGVSGEELKNALEELNIGRLRIASKGVDRNPAYGDGSAGPRLLPVEPVEQWRQGLYMIGQVAALHRQVGSIEDLHENVSSGSTRHLRDRFEVVSEEPAPPPAAVAIVGMSTILPGAPDLDTFWANVIAKKDVVTEVPKSRWDADRYFDPDKAARDKVYSRWGGFIDEVPFDPVEFGMPPNTLTSIEPFQLMALLVVRDALKDAGYAERPFSRETTSVIIGAGGGAADLTSGYIVRSSLPTLFGDKAGEVADSLTGVLPEWTEDSFAGFLMNVAAGRIANRFNFGGVNYTVDAACASSLAAIYLGVRDLEAKTSDVVIVGGVESIQTPFGFLSFSKTQALSPTGRSRPFDATADGIAISEGFAAVVLKRLEDAERDGDRIYAVIRGVGGSSDGRDRSLTAPRPEGQVRAYRRAYANAGFSPASVGLIEAHGTGTVAGDQSELSSLRQVFDAAGAETQGTAIGSVKSMIGHTKAAAGVAGLTKVAKALYHRVLPPTLGVTEPNPLADFEHSPFYVNSEARPWVKPAGSEPRRAGVSAFGFGGTNFHITLEEYQGAYLPATEPSIDTWPAELFVWRSESRAGLMEQVTALQSQLDGGAQPRPADLAYTLGLQVTASQGSAVLAIVASSIVELQERLQGAQKVLQGNEKRAHLPAGVHFSEAPLADEGKVAFVFPGQGSQYVNMGRELAVAFPDVRSELDEADALTAGLLDRPLSRYVYPPPAFEKGEEKRQQEALTETNVTQPALGATEMAMLRLLQRLGLSPDLAAGHSYGEFVALFAAGSLSKQALLHLSATRGRLMKEAGGEGAMAAVLAPPESITDLAIELDLTLANLNSPTQTVVSGTADAIECAVVRCSERGLAARRLPVGSAFHSPLVAGIKADFAGALCEVELAAPRFPVFSNTTAEEYPSDPAEMRSLLAEHLARPVNFAGEIEAMYEAGARLFVEVGPRQVLTGLIAQILGEREHIALSLDNPSKPGLWPLLNALGALSAEGVAVDLAQLFKGRKVRRLDMMSLLEDSRPTYSPTTWMVSGGSVRPLDRQLPRATLPLEIHLGREVERGSPDGPASSAPANGSSGVPDQRHESVPAHSPQSTGLAPEAVAGSQGVMQHFQQVMDRFLEVQSTNMTEIFRRAGAPGGGLPSPAASGNGHAPVSSVAPVGATPIRRYLVKPVAAEPASRTAGLDPDGFVVIAGGDPGFAAQVAQRVQDAGYKTAKVGFGDGAGRNGSTGTLRMAAGASQEDASALVRQLHAAHGLVSAVVFLGDIERAGDEELGSGCAELFLLSQALRDDLLRAAATGGAAVVGVSAMGGSFGFGDEAVDSFDRGWLPGFLKSLAQEWSAVRVKALDLGRHDASGAERVVTELLCEGPVEVGYDSLGARRRLMLQEAPLEATAPRTALDSGCVVLAIGGGRGITAEACVALAAETQATFVLAGRTPLPSSAEDARTAGLSDEGAIKAALLDQASAGGQKPSPRDIERVYRDLMGARELRRTLSRLATAGSKFDYRVCDVQDAGAFERLIDDVYRRYGRLDGVVHGAGVIEDRLIEDKTLESFQRVLATKLRPAQVLAQKLRPESLRFLALFSSVTARVGNRGQTDYAGANEALNKLAQSLDRRWPGRVVSINWGPWAGAGMVTPEAQRQFEARNVDLIPVETGAAMFVRELLHGAKGDVEVTIASLRGQAIGEVSATPSGSEAMRGLPLLGMYNPVASEPGVTTLRGTLTLERDVYLKHHVLGDRPVLPFAFATELMAEAAFGASPEAEVVAVSDIRVLQGIVMEEPALELEVTAHRRAPGENGSSQHDVYDVTVARASDPQRASYRATVELGDAAGDMRRVASAIETCSSPLGEDAAALPVSLEEAYERWLFHGPLLQAIDSVDAIGPGGATGVLRLSDPRQCFAGGTEGAWVFDPILLDAAFQMQLLWGRTQWGVTLLPSAVQRVARLSAASAPRPGDRVRCELRVRRDSRSPISHTDFVFFNEAGEPIAAVVDLECSGSEALNRMVGAENWRGL